MALSLPGYSTYKIMAVNLHEICRLCLEEIKTPSASLKEGSSLLTKLRRFLPVLKIHPGDGLPILVCDQCESLVNICYNFKLQVERSDSALQKYCISQQFAQIVSIISSSASDSCGTSWTGFHLSDLK
ncbi:zinc finger protein pita-like isoform X3 [Periplaneta americana]|uniref:zinc finger protein pita-like isoform X3 n=1 Tax=Periplaneta americana TaxID=6978 RepID=UPI0037E7D793